MEFYSIPLFAKIKTTDLLSSANWYKEKLGFISVFDFTDADGTIVMSHLRRDKYQDLMLIQVDDCQASDRIILNLAVDNIEELRSRMQVNEIVNDLKKQPWNALEMTIRSLDGTTLTLTKQLNSGNSFNDVLSKLI